MVMEKLKKALSGEDDEEKGIVTQVIDSHSLSWETRIKGFVICFILGILFSVVGSIFIFFGNMVTFAVFYSLGSLTALCSTCFLMGPVSQCKKMFEMTRLIATIVMLCCIVATIVVAVVMKKKGGPLVLILVVIQFLAVTWYSISYIPFARDAVKKCFASCLS